MSQRKTVGFEGTAVDEKTALLNDDPFKNKDSLSVFLIRRKDWGKSVKLGDPYKVLVSEFNQLVAKFEVALMMHKITSQYYGHRAFWFTFFPLLLVTTGVSILGFIQTPGDNPDDSVIIDGGDGFLNSFNSTSSEASGSAASNIEMQQATVSLLVGLLGVLSTALASLGKHLNYQSKADMHESAVITLRSILDDLAFERLDVKHEKRIARCHKRDANLLTEHEIEELRVAIEMHKSKFDTMEKSCVVPIPYQIKNAFIDLEEHCQLMPRTVRDEYYRRYYNQLNNAFQTTGCSSWFPCFLPNISVEELLGERIKLDMHYAWKATTAGKATYGQSHYDCEKAKGDASEAANDPEVLEACCKDGEHSEGESEGQDMKNENSLV